MIDPADIHSLTDFQRDVKAHLRRLRKHRRPVLLTVNGRSAAVVLDPATYRKFMNQLTDLHERDEVRKGLADVRAGRVRPLADFLSEFRAKRGLIQRRRRSA